MKYEIRVEGGFAGIPKNYEGEVDMSQEDISKLVEVMNISKPVNLYLRDGLSYFVTLFDDEKSIDAQFDEKSLPEMFRHLISK